MTEFAQAIDFARQMFLGFAQNLSHILLRPASIISAWSLMAAACLAYFWLARRRKARPSARYLNRVLLPNGYLTSRSATLDWIMVLANHTVLPLMIGFITIASPMISDLVSGGLNAVSSGPAMASAPDWMARIITTLMLFLAYEFGYFVDHTLSHRVPFLWEFHKVHHSAETLSPLTNFRVHPVDSFLFANIVAITMGFTGALCLWLFGAAAKPFALDGVNILMLAFMFTILHLQHAQLWIRLPGKLGHWLLSPAHHQLHHSTDPAHFNCNMGSTTTVFDRMFSSHILPQERPKALRFGVDGLTEDPHGLRGAFITPFVDAGRHFGRSSAHLSKSAHSL